jgi:hypothetical protein
MCRPCRADVCLKFIPLEIAFLVVLRVCVWMGGLDVVPAEDGKRGSVSGCGRERGFHGFV